MDESDINSILTNTRNRLKEIQESINKPNQTFSELIEDINEVSAQLKKDSENMISIPQKKSDVLSLVSEKHKKRTIVKKAEEHMPKDCRLYKSNKATIMRKEFIKVEKIPRKLPILKGKYRNMDAETLIAKGIISRADDMSCILPSVGPGRARNENMAFLPMYKIDLSGAAETIRWRRRLQDIQTSRKFSKSALQKEVSSILSEESDDEEEEHNNQEYEEKPNVPSVPRIYEEIQDEYASQTLLVIKQKIARDTPDFESFKRTNDYRWDKIENVFSWIQKFCAIYDIQYAEINGRKLTETASLDCINLDHALFCLNDVDREKLEKIENEMALKIQNVWKRKVEINKQKERKHIFWSAFKIQRFWRSRKERDKLLRLCKEKVETVTSRADQLLSMSLDTFIDDLDGPHIYIIVVSSFHDIMKLFLLMYDNVTLILIVNYLPNPYIYQDFIEFLGCCGLQNANERIHYVLLKNIEGYNSISDKMFIDLRSIKSIKKLLCSRPAFVLPHSVWKAEHLLAVDIHVPILGAADVDHYESRWSIMNFFKNAGIVIPLATEQNDDPEQLFISAMTLMRQNKDLSRWIVRLGFTHTDDGVAWFESTKELMYSEDNICDNFKKVLNTVQKPSAFINCIENCGATVEAAPPSIHSFPSVSAFIDGSNIRIIGTFDRVHHAPFRFGCNIVPAISVDGTQLLAMAKATCAQIMKSSYIGYVMIDFIAFKENGDIKIMGYDIRFNCFPSLLTATYGSLLTDYDETTNKMKLIQNVGKSGMKNTRYAVVQSGLTHSGFAHVSSKDVRAACFDDGFMFDLMLRTGFKLIFFDSPSEGKNFCICSGVSIGSTIPICERSYQFLQKFLASKVPSDENSTITRSLIGIRHFKSRVL